MPSVGMRRTTRVFGARVLRSGRRLWTAAVEGKHIRASANAGGAANGEEWIELFDNSGDAGGGGNEIQLKENGWRHDVASKEEATAMEVDEKIAEPKSVRNVDRDHKRMWGSVYKRKRKGVDFVSLDCGGSSKKKKRTLEDRKYGKQFVRKQWGRFPCPLDESCGWQSSGRRRVLFAVVESSSCSSTCWFACFLGLVLSYLRRAKMRLLQLSAFVLSEPLACVFSSHGIRFLRDSPPVESSGICKFFGASCFVPMFTVDFSAVPFCFMYLHSSLLLRSACLPCVLEMHSNLTDDIMNEEAEHLPSCISYEKDSPALGDNNSKKRNILQSTVGALRSTGRAAQTRSVVRSRRIQKRSSLRSRRNKIPSAFRSRKANGALVSNLLSSRYELIPLPPVMSDRQLRSSVRKFSTPSNRELKTSLVGLTRDIGSTCCSANILVIESDKCFRIKGAIIKLEKVTASKQWSLAVKKDGITRHTLTAQKIMRPCSSNRVTHDIIWTEDIYNWKLEFPDRRDWLIFKELYKECSHRNVQAPSANTIPVPGVYEVSDYADSNNTPFNRPHSYISVKDDELSRALEKRAANYDLDSEDEVWLREFNNESSEGNEQRDHVSEDIFELIIDAFEKAFYCSSDDYLDEKAAVNLCLDMERKEVVEAVYSYWMKKRQLKGSALVRVFQCYQLRRAQLLPKNILRKKRSFKRQPSHSGRGKQRTFLQAVPEQKDGLEEKNALLRVQEAKAAASRSEGLAVEKRQTAQLLMENADLATFKAAMAIRIAESARVAESADVAASFFL